MEKGTVFKVYEVDKWLKYPYVYKEHLYITNVAIGDDVDIASEVDQLEFEGFVSKYVARSYQKK